MSIFSQKPLEGSGILGICPACWSESCFIKVNVLQVGSGFGTATLGQGPADSCQTGCLRHFINSPAISPGYLEFDLGARSKVLSLSPNKQPQPLLASSCSAVSAAPPPFTPKAVSPCEVSLTGGLGPRQGSRRLPLSLLAQSFLSGLMARASPGSLQGHWETLPCVLRVTRYFSRAVISAKRLCVLGEGRVVT